MNHDENDQACGLIVIILILVFILAGVFVTRSDHNSDDGVQPYQHDGDTIPYKRMGRR